jgi:monofunctional biosynthetic peptidoglycan transglycosylase
MNKALQDMIQKGEIRGASTISMQVARTVFLWDNRDIFRKIFEAYYTVIVELLWSKERILEVYLNSVDWGAGTRGAEKAAVRYFSCSCSRLNPNQAASLAAILPCPHRWSPVRPNQRVMKRKRRILRDMNKMPLLTCSPD